MKVIVHTTKQFFEKGALMIHISHAVIILARDESLTNQLLDEIPLLISLLKHPSEEVQINSCLAIAALASHIKANSLQQIQLSSKVTGPLIDLYQETSSRNIQVKVGEAVLELCSHVDFVDHGGLILFTSLAMSEDEELQLLILGMVSRMCDVGSGIHTRVMNEGGLLPFLSLLSSRSESVKVNSIKLLRRMIDIGGQMPDKFVESGVFYMLGTIIGESTNKEIVLESLQAIETLASNNKNLGVVVKHKELLQNLTLLLSTRKETNILLLTLNIIQLLSPHSELLQLMKRMDTLQRTNSLSKSIGLDGRVREVASTVISSFKKKIILLWLVEKR